jgi:FxLD family lantipeptide
MPQTVETTEREDIFLLDVQVITEYDEAGANARCSTDDGCATTCASSCASRG